MTRFIALALVAVLPIQAHACLTHAQDSSDSNGPCVSSFETQLLPSTSSSSAGDTLAEVLRPQARPDWDVAEKAADAGQDPLLSPRAMLFWDVA